MSLSFPTYSKESKTPDLQGRSEDYVGSDISAVRRLPGLGGERGAHGPQGCRQRPARPTPPFLALLASVYCPISFPVTFHMTTFWALSGSLRLACQFSGAPVGQAGLGRPEVRRARRREVGEGSGLLEPHSEPPRMPGSTLSICPYPCSRGHSCPRNSLLAHSRCPVNERCLAPWFFLTVSRSPLGFCLTFLPSCVHSLIQHMPNSTSHGPAPCWGSHQVGTDTDTLVSVIEPAPVGQSGAPRRASTPAWAGKACAGTGPAVSRDSGNHAPGGGWGGTHRSVARGRRGTQLGSRRARAADFGCPAREPDSGSESRQVPIGLPECEAFLELPGGPGPRGQDPTPAFCQSHRVCLVSQQPASVEHLLCARCAWCPSSCRDTAVNQADSGLPPMGGLHSGWERDSK